jgi:acetoin utilization deacetylase AcuC-like enzyme
MKVITDPRCTQYRHPGHPERPERISRTVDRLKAQDRVSLSWAEPVAPTPAQLGRAHSALLLTRLEHPKDMDGDTPSLPDIAAHARRSAGAALLALDEAMAGRTADRAMGFCYLNNAAIAALEAVARGKERVAVFDFDFHHGNGTEAILQGVPQCAFYSVHLFPAYPGTGTGPQGNAFNYPLVPGVPRAGYLAVLEQAIADLSRFRPEVVIVSAGFDSFIRDPVGGASLELEDFEWLGRQLGRLEVPVCHVLEGGYSPELPELILAYLTGLSR